MERLGDPTSKPPVIGHQRLLLVLFALLGAVGAYRHSSFDMLRGGSCQGRQSLLRLHLVELFELLKKRILRALIRPHQLVLLPQIHRVPGTIVRKLLL